MKETAGHEKETEISSHSDDELLKAVKSCELWDALRKFANKDVALIARLIYEDGPRTLGELRDKSGLTTNKVNHTLIDMRGADLVKKIGRRYYLTKYAAVLLESLNEIRKGVTNIPEDSLLKPVPFGKKDIKEISDNCAEEAEDACSNQRTL